MREGDGRIQPADQLLIAVGPRAGIAEGVRGQRPASRRHVPAGRRPGRALRASRRAGVRVDLRDPPQQGLCPRVLYGCGGDAPYPSTSVVKYLSSMSQDYADLFCELFDRLDPAEVHAEGEAWMADATVAATAAGVEQAALDGEPVATPDGGRQTFAVLLGLDAALAHANPLSRRSRPACAHRVRAPLRGGGPPRLGCPSAAPCSPASPARAAAASCPTTWPTPSAPSSRVGAADWDACDHAALPARSRLTRPEREAGLRVATAPMIREPDELEWEMEERSGLRFYRIHPADREPTRARVERVIAAWDEQDVAIGIAPELCLSRALLERWQVALRERRARGPAGCAWSWRAAATSTARHRRRTKRCCSTRARARCSSVSARSTRSTSRTRISSCGGWPIA